MTSTPQFAHCDTRRPNGFYVQFERVLLDDPDSTPKDKPQGYSRAQVKAWQRGHWRYVGIRARALCMIVQNGTGTYVNLDSPGLWGVESNSGENYLNECYGQEIAALKDMIAAMRDPVYETV